MRNTNSFSNVLYAKNPLHANTQKELVRLAQNGSKEAQDELVSTNLRFIRMIAGRYGICDEYEINELVSEGSAGLIKAIYRFDANRECTFMTYAVWWIKNSISSYIRGKSRLIRQPESNQKDLGYVMIPIHSPRFNEDGSSSTIEDLIEQTTFEDPSNIMDEKEISRYIDDLLRKIPYQQATVIRRRFGIDGDAMTYEELSKHMNINKEKLKTMCERGLREIRKYITFSPNREDLLQYIQTE